MTTIAVAMFLLLASIAAVHLLWAFGSHWPARSERELVALAVGRTGQTRMPSSMQCIAATTAIFVSGLWALGLVDLVALPFNSAVITSAGAVVAGVFAVRGIAAYLPAWRWRFAQEPFATLDREKYGPHCLIFAAGFSALVINRIGT
jgi:hypothetical protein